MPIDEGQVTKQNLLILPASMTVAQAARKLLGAGGQDWWRLLIEQTRGVYATLIVQSHDPDIPALGSFADLRRAVEGARDRKALFQMTLDELELTPVDAVEQESMSTRRAENQALASEAQMVVVLREGEFVGLIDMGSRAVDDVPVLVSLEDLLKEAGEPLTEPKEEAGDQAWATRPDEGE